MSLASAFTSAVLPILAVMALGYALGSTIDLDVDPLNTVALYAFLPALIFHSLATTPLGGRTVLKVFAGVVAFVFAMLVLSEAAGRLWGVTEPYRSALVLASAFPNAGFYGIPLAEFAFGDLGRAIAVLYITAQSFLMYTIGVYIASRGGGHAGVGAIREIFELPLIYAIALAVLVRQLGVVPPPDGTVMTTVSLVGDASIPLMLVIVGVQLAGLEAGALSRVAIPTVLKLGVAPVVALAIAAGLAFENPTIARIFVLLCATPVALIPLALTIAYGDRDGETGSSGELSASEYLTTAIFVTTIASVVVLTVLIAVLRSGALI
jgi:predicted permease